jgi:hypothetical protein
MQNFDLIIQLVSVGVHGLKAIVVEFKLSTFLKTCITCSIISVDGSEQLRLDPSFFRDTSSSEKYSFPKEDCNYDYIVL